jgi:hypothetical protein
MPKPQPGLVGCTLGGPLTQNSQFRGHLVTGLLRLLEQLFVNLTPLDLGAEPDSQLVSLLPQL